MGLDTDRGWSRIRRVPGSIPGATESDFLSYFWEISEDFGVCSGHIFGHFSDIFGDVWDIFSEIFRTFSDMFGTCFRTFFEYFRTCLGHIFGHFPDFDSDFLIFLTVPKRVLFS